MLSPAVRYPLVFYYFLYFAYHGAYYPYISLYLQTTGITATQMGFLFAIPQASRIIGPFIWGTWADHHPNPLRILQISFIASFISFIGLYLGHGFTWMFICLSLTHFFTSGQMPLVESSTIKQVRSSPGEYGRIRVWGSLGFIVAVSGLGYTLNHTPPIWLLHATTFILGLMLPLGWLIPNPARTPPASSTTTDIHSDTHLTLTDIWGIVRQKEVRSFLLAGCCNAFAHTALYAFFTLHLIRLGYDTTTVGLYWALGVGAEIILLQSMPFILRSIPLNQLYFVTFIACAVRFLLIAWAASWWGWIVIAQILHALTFALYHSSSVTLVGHYFGVNAAARGQAIYISMTYGLGGFIGALTAGYLWDNAGPSWVFTVSAIAGVIGGILFYPHRSTIRHH